MSSAAYQAKWQVVGYCVPVLTLEAGLTDFLTGPGLTSPLHTSVSTALMSMLWKATLGWAIW